MKNTEINIGMDKLYYSSYFFLIASLYALYNKLYLCSILIFYLFITSVVHWKDYNNKFKLCGDHYMIFIFCFYTIFISFKIKNYICLISLGLLFILYRISNHYRIKNNYLVDSNIWILTHTVVSVSMIYILNKIRLYYYKNN